MRKSVVRIGLIGCGRVGGGVLRLLSRNRSLIEPKLGARLEVAWACDRNPQALRAASARRRTRNSAQVIADPSVDIVVELIGGPGDGPAKSVILSALRAGKHVVTANKAVLALHWDEVFGEAQARGRLVYFEASVGGGIPVIQALNEGLAANRIQSIWGILNGTTNFILTRMGRDGLSYAEALRRARACGFAEKDPSADVDGWDAAHKLSILASIAYGAHLPISEVAVQGIRDVEAADISFARRLGYGVKLLAVAERRNGRLWARVHPALVPAGHPLNACEDEFNAIYITGDAVGQTMYYGKGAGPSAAASAVVSDLIFLGRRVATDTVGNFPYVVYDRRRRLNLGRPADLPGAYYLRLRVPDEPGVLGRICGVLGRHRISIHNVIQSSPADRRADVVLLTHRTFHGRMEKAMAEIGRARLAAGRPVCLRLEDPR